MRETAKDDPDRPPHLDQLAADIKAQLAELEEALDKRDRRGGLPPRAPAP